MTASSPAPLAPRLATGRPLLLDAAMGTELHRRGARTTLPLWSALGVIEQPDLVRAIHRDNLLAGADVITTATFRTTRRTMRHAGRDPDEAAALTRRAVELARQARDAAGRPDALIAGSIAPLEDCYSPWLSPPFAVALAEHREQARLLAAAGVDFLLVETMPCAAEAKAALIAARETGLEATVGFVCQTRPGPAPVVELLSGEPLAAAVARVSPHDPTAILVNCAPPPVIAAALAELRSLTDRSTGGYANVGVVDPITGWAADSAVTGDRYAAAAAEWIRLGARLIGGCCGTTPGHTAALRTLLDHGPYDRPA